MNKILLINIVIILYMAVSVYLVCMETVSTNIFIMYVCEPGYTGVNCEIGQ